jgi:hypothetical protein
MRQDASRDYPTFIYCMNQFGCLLSCLITFYNPVSISSDLLCVYLIEYVAILFKIWGQELKEKLDETKFEKNQIDEEENGF